MSARPAKKLNARVPDSFAQSVSSRFDPMPSVPESRTRTADGSELVIEWIDGPVLSDRLVSEWNDLASSASDSSLFLTPLWTTTWWRHFGKGRLRLLTARRGGRLVALLPLAERRTRYFGAPMRFLASVGEPQADRLGLLAADADEEDAVEHLSRGMLNALGRVDGIRLSEIPAGSPLDAALRRRLALGEVVGVQRVCARAPILRLDAARERIESEYSHSLRTRLKRARRKQQKAGEVTFRRWQCQPVEVSDVLARFREIEDRSWKGKHGVGIFSPAPRWAFILDLSLQLARRGWLDVAVLALNGRWIAYRFGFRFRNVFLDYSLSHDPEFNGLSPGRVLLEEIIWDSQRLGLEAVDASRGKLQPPHPLAEWPTVSRWHRRWILCASTLRGRWLACMERRVKPAWRRLRGKDIELPPEVADPDPLPH